MDSRRNLMLAELALQVGLIDWGQFTEISRVLALRPQASAADLLIERGWLLPADRVHLDYLLDRKLHKQHSATLQAPAEGGAADPPAARPDQEVSRTVMLPPPAPGAAQEVATLGDAVASKRYLLRAMHGLGGIGRVWRAWDSHMEREVAVKELLPERTRDPRVARRFLREARLTGQLEHPGIVPVHELSRLADTQGAFYTMRLVRGRTLSEAVNTYHRNRAEGKSEPLELISLLTAFVAVCNTIAYAHSRGVIHRDLKGDNIILGDFGEVIVLDWGLAKRVDRAEDEGGGCVLADLMQADAERTMQGQVIGTPAFMAPEQAAGRLDLVGPLTDIYGLGAILYVILTGQAPFSGSNTIEILRSVQRSLLKPPHELWPEVPAGLEAVCLRAMAKDPAGRYPSAAEVGQEVQRWQDVQRRKAEDALRRQSGILQSILNSMSEGVVVADVEGRLIHINPAAQRLTGIEPADTTLDDARQRYGLYHSDQVTPCPPEDLPLARAMRGEEVDDAEMFLRAAGRDDGLWTSINARPLRDESGAVFGGVMVFRDVTERKKAEEDLRRSRERFELAVAGSQDGLWDWNLLTDEVYFSPRWKDIIGYEESEISNHVQEWIDRLHPDERERVLAANYAHIHGTTPHYEYEYRLRHKDGSYRWILARGVALRDPAGNAYRMAGSHVDVTERRRVEEALRVSEDRYQSVLDALPIGVVVLNGDGRLHLINKAAEQILGISAPESKGRYAFEPCWQAIGEDGCPLPWDLQPAVQSLRTGRAHGPVVMGIPKRGGEATSVAAAAVPLSRPNEHLPYCVVASFAPRTGPSAGRMPGPVPG
jgi:PAS domain S-box-containing protein